MNEQARQAAPAGQVKGLLAALALVALAAVLQDRASVGAPAVRDGEMEVAKAKPFVDGPLTRPKMPVMTAARQE